MITWLSNLQSYVHRLGDPKAKSIRDDSIGQKCDATLTIFC